MEDNSFSYSGLKIEQIENYSDHATSIKHLLCCICLEVALNPYECTECEVLFCENCMNTLRIAGKECVRSKCRNKVKKGNRFLRELLSMLIIKCIYCGTSSLKYQDYCNHLEECKGYQENPLVKLKKKIIMLDKTIEDKTKELCGIHMLSINPKNSVKKKRSANIRNISSSSGRQSSGSSIEVTFGLGVGQKMEIYDATVEGRAGDFKHLILVKKYPLFEEISAHGFYWTALHYAMHYGQMEIISFILDYCKSNGWLDKALRLESNDNRCPILCLLKSNSINTSKKREILEKILSKFIFRLNEDAIREIRGRNMQDILNKYR